MNTSNAPPKPAPFDLMLTFGSGMKAVWLHELGDGKASKMLLAESDSFRRSRYLRIIDGDKLEHGDRYETAKDFTYRKLTGPGGLAIVAKYFPELVGRYLWYSPYGSPIFLGVVGTPAPVKAKAAGKPKRPAGVTATMEIYNRLRGERDENGVAETSSKEVAILVRERLKKEFPGHKFRVKSDWSSINVYWTDGPRYSEVNAIISEYKFGGFDGMIDLDYTYSNWLLPDGRLRIASNAGTVGSRGSVSAIATDSPGPGAIIVRHGPKYVFANREVSDKRWRELAEELAEKTGWEIDHDKPYWSNRINGESVSTWIHRMEEGAFDHLVEN